MVMCKINIIIIVRIINSKNYNKLSSILENNRNDRSINNHSINIPYHLQYPVKKGSVVGAFVKVSLFQPPLLVIGQSSNGGVCHLLSGVNENTNNLTCTADNYIANQIVHIEAIVSKLICYNY